MLFQDTILLPSLSCQQTVAQVPLTNMSSSCLCPWTTTCQREGTKDFFPKKPGEGGCTVFLLLCPQLVSEMVIPALQTGCGAGSGWCPRSPSEDMPLSLMDNNPWIFWLASSTHQTLGISGKQTEPPLLS